MKLDAYEMMSSCSSSSIGCLSADSSSNSVSSNMVEDGDDASSSPANRVEQMFQLSDLMSQLPIKRGLSRYYNGKSDSFKNLTSIKSLEDVPKLSSKGRSSNINRCQKFYTTPKSKISKSNNKASTWISGRNNRLTTSSNTRICTRFIHA
ncbi:unnamed protein product [Rhodiola kirilowii]